MPRRWLNSLLAFCLALSPAAAQDYDIVMPDGRSAGVWPQLYRGTCTVNDAATTSPVTQTGVVIPGIVAGDVVHFFVGVIAEDGLATFSISSMTVDGAAASEIVDEDGTGIVNSGFYSIGPVVADGTVDVTVSYSENITSSGVCIWAVKNLRSGTVTSSVIDDETNGGDVVLTTGTTVAGGWVLAVCVGSAITATLTIGATLTEREQTQSGEIDYSTGDGPATGASMANTCNSSGTEDNSGAAIAIR